MSLLDRIPKSVMINSGMKLLGLSDGEKHAIDSVISSVGNLPPVALATGRELTNAEQLIDYVMSSNGTNTQMAQSLGKFLSTPEMRGAVAQYITGTIAKQKNAKDLYSALGKVSEFPMAPWASTQYSDEVEFLSEGILKTLSDHVNDVAAESDNSHVTICPHCNKLHAI